MKINWKYILFVFIVLVIVRKYGCSIRENKPATSESEVINVKQNTEKQTAEAPSFKIIDPKLVVLSGSELGNYVIDKKLSGESSNLVHYTYGKKIDEYTENNLILTVRVFADDIEARTALQADVTSHFSKMVPDGEGGMEKNNFYSKRIPIEKFGDTSFCYSFVSPTVEVQYRNYIIESNFTKDYVYENISESNSATVKKSIKIAKQQINKIDSLYKIY